MTSASLIGLLVLAAALLSVCAAWCVVTAQRLDRLHIRVDRSRDALQAALDRRCAVLAVAYPQLAPAAHAAEAVQLRPDGFTDRLRAEDELRDLAAGLADSQRPEIADADTRVMLALRFYNDAVADTRALRLNPLVRGLRLGGTAALPSYCSLRDVS